MKFTKAGNAIRNLVFSIAGSQYQEIVAISFCWNKILGDLISKRTTIVKCENGVLFVSVSNNIWMQELVLTKSDLMEQIAKQSAVKLRDIVFYLDSNENKLPNYLRRKRRNG